MWRFSRRPRPAPVLWRLQHPRHPRHPQWRDDAQSVRLRRSRPTSPLDPLPRPRQRRLPRQLPPPLPHPLLPLRWRLRLLDRLRMGAGGSCRPGRGRVRGEGSSWVARSAGALLLSLAPAWKRIGSSRTTMVEVCVCACLRGTMQGGRSARVLVSFVLCCSGLRLGSTIASVDSLCHTHSSLTFTLPSHSTAGLARASSGSRGAPAQSA